MDQQILLSIVEELRGTIVCRGELKGRNFMADNEFITDQLTAVHPDGTRSVVAICIGKPSKDEAETYVCHIRAPGLGKPIGIYGEGPMQALHLGLKMVRRRLELFEEEQGVRFVFPETDEPNDWRAFWYGDVGAKPD
jgi:hypothetical protein